MVKKVAPKPVPVLVRVPPPILKRLDAAASAQGRSRSKELCMRLAESFKRAKEEKAVA